MDTTNRVGFLPIPPVPQIGPAGKATANGHGEGDSSSAAASFAQVLKDAVDSVNTAQLQADEATARLAAGEPVDLHQVTLAVEKASIAFQLALQVRTKLLEAYQDVMRMQV